MKSQARLSVLIDNKKKHALKVEAAKEGKTLRVLVIEIIDGYLKKSKTDREKG